MLASWVCQLVVWVASPVSVPSFCSADGPGEISLWRLERDVEERERHLARARCELAEARARLAQAEGRRALAISELRNAVAYYQAEVRWARDNRNRSCDPAGLLAGADWDLARARAWLAEVEGETAALVAELKKVVGYQEKHLQSVQRLAGRGAVHPEEVKAAQEGLSEARGRLEAAEKWLEAEQAKKPKKSK